MRRFMLVSALVAAVLSVAACGESSQDKAKKKVCDARADIQKQVNELKSLTPATATTSGIKDNLSAIQDDLQTIADAQGDLNAERKKEVQQANDKFVSEFKSTVQDLGTSVSASEAKPKLQAAAQQLAATYESSFAGVNCS
jgi:Tfp pilus assembly protein PilP